MLAAADIPDRQGLREVVKVVGYQAKVLALSTRVADVSSSKFQRKRPTGAESVYEV